MSSAYLSLFEDVLANATAHTYPARPRMIYVVHGSVSVAGREFGDDTAWHGEEGADVIAGAAGATLWRWELSKEAPALPSAPAAGMRSALKLTEELGTLPAGELLLRGDSVAFPPGGCAFTHVHQGPGIRCLIQGGIRIDTDGHSTAYGPGGAWFESGPEPVFAQAAQDRPSRFIRTMILPRALLGKSSISYVNEADKDKPKSQSYKGYVDAPIAFAG